MSADGTRWNLYSLVSRILNRGTWKGFVFNDCVVKIRTDIDNASSDGNLHFKQIRVWGGTDPRRSCEPITEVLITEFPNLVPSLSPRPAIGWSLGTMPCPGRHGSSLKLGGP